MGSISDVWLAEPDDAYSGREPGAERLVVVKRLSTQFAEDPEFLAFFLNEGYIGRQLSHSNIVRTLDFGYADGQYFHAMEYVLGESLDRVMRRAFNRQRQLPLAFAIDVGLASARALAYAHNARNEWGRPLHIVHRDVAPHNILAGFDGSVRLTDFGIAKFARQLHSSLPGTLKGHLGYLAPEQVQGREVDARTDLFSLGVVLYELVSGRPLFRSDRDWETTRRILDAPIPPLSEVRPDCPLELDWLIQRMLKRDPNERPHPAAMLAAELATIRDRTTAPPDAVAAEMHELFFERIASDLPSEYYLDYECTRPQPPRSRFWMVASILLAVTVMVLVAWVVAHRPTLAARVNPLPAPAAAAAAIPPLANAAPAKPPAADEPTPEKPRRHHMRLAYATDPANCGHRGHVCTFSANSYPMCSDGRCDLACHSGFASCDGDAANGCETNVGIDPDNCGACAHACGGGECRAGQCQPAALAVGQPLVLVPGALAVDTMGVSWLTASRGQLAVVWLARGSSSPKSSPSASPRPRSPALRRGEAPPVPKEIVDPFAIAFDESYVYWTDFKVDGAVRRMRLGGGAIEELATNQGKPAGLALSHGEVFWVNHLDGTVQAMPTAGGSPRTIASLQNHPVDIAVDDHEVFWTDSGSGVVMKAPRTGGEATTLAVSQNRPAAIALDAAAVYWTNVGDGTVMRLAR
jgi:serine/threonine-protein kinase